MIFIFLLFYIIFFVLSIVFILFVLAQFIAIFTTHTPFVPVPSQIEEEIINALELKNNSVLYDLGCGDGRILLKAVQKHPNIQAIGIEIGFVP